VKRWFFLIFLLSVFALWFWGRGLQPGTEMMLNLNGALSLADDVRVRLASTGADSFGFDYRTLVGIKVRVISDNRSWFDPSGGINIRVLEGELRNQTFTADRDWLSSLSWY